ncbi:MAG TPA: 2Fe-2S iron-sulfur cluster-binding protein, partial [Acidobacteriaceae bacterium]
MQDEEQPQDAAEMGGQESAGQQSYSGAPCSWPVSRRDFVKGAGVATGAAALGLSPAAPAFAEPQAADLPITPVALKITINGEPKQLSLDPRTSLLDLLREDLKLTGTKKGCDHGQCGACTILADGRRINSCLALAVCYDGAQITSIEGLAKGDTLDPVQLAFLEHDGYQCGYCTPGQILSAVALLAEAHRGAPSIVTADLRRTGPVDLTIEETKERMSGNICRCGAYPGIVAAVRQVYGAGSPSAAKL